MISKRSFIRVLKMEVDELMLCCELLGQGRFFGRSEDEIPGRRPCEIGKLHLSILIRYNWNFNDNINLTSKIALPSWIKPFLIELIRILLIRIRETYSTRSIQWQIVCYISVLKRWHLRLKSASLIELHRIVVPIWLPCWIIRLDISISIVWSLSWRRLWVMCIGWRILEIQLFDQSFLSRFILKRKIALLNFRSVILLKLKLLNWVSLGTVIWKVLKNYSIRYIQLIFQAKLLNMMICICKTGLVA